MHPNQNPTSNSFPTPQSLSNWLKSRLPSTSLAAWGAQPGTKNVHNLWLELSQGETTLIDSTPPIRTVNVVTVTIISPDGLHLIETRQELSDGSFRDRGRPLSEKMKPGETVENAVMRAVREELGLEGIDGVNGVRIVPGSYMKRGLPHEEEFWTEEEGEECRGCDEAARVADEAVFVKKHYWRWIAADDHAPH
ncbi:hypothetical protein Syun_019964 [Stephania yunnanensis]|uniref:Nudix hydrolase domain-containing protein n=1 Tax=Stephania yunnanensis TaxID=152371 RepID=A0AAP0NWB9_9MAGN